METFFTFLSLIAFIMAVKEWMKSFKIGLEVKDILKEEGKVDGFFSFIKYNQERSAHVFQLIFTKASMIKSQIFEDDSIEVKNKKHEGIRHLIYFRNWVLIFLFLLFSDILFSS